MSYQPKKPPVEISELVEREEEESGRKGERRKLVRHEKGKLGYLGGEGKTNRFSGLRDSGKIFSTKNLTLVGLAFLISLTASFLIFTRQSDSEILLDNQRILQEAITKTDGKANLNEDEIDDIVMDMDGIRDIIEDHVTTSQLKSAIREIDLSSYAKITQLGDYTLLVTFNKEIGALNSTLQELWEYAHNNTSG